MGGRQDGGLWQNEVDHYWLFICSCLSPLKLEIILLSLVALVCYLENNVSSCLYRTNSFILIRH